MLPAAVKGSFRSAIERIHCADQAAVYCYCRRDAHDEPRDRIEPKYLYGPDGRDLCPRRNHACPADHLRVVGGDRRLDDSVLAKLAGRSYSRCPCIPRVLAAKVIRVFVYGVKSYA